MNAVEKVKANVSRFTNQRFFGEVVGVYLIELKTELILFDIPSYSKEVELFLKSKNKPLKAFLSHGSTGISDTSTWQKRLDMKVHMHARDADHGWLSVTPDVLFDTNPFIDASLEIIHTPGHSSGSICLLDKTTKCLFTGDTVEGDTNGQVKNFYENLGGNKEAEDRLQSCRKLLNCDFELLLPFHYDMVLSNAKRTLSDFVDSVTIT